MARYFYHLYGEDELHDLHGIAFGEIDSAREAARRIAIGQIHREIDEGHLNLDHRLELTDETGLVIEVLRWRDVFTIEG